MDEKQINRIVKEFCDNVDNELKMEQELNQLAEQIAARLIMQPNSTEAVLDTYNGIVLAFQFFWNPSNNNAVVKCTDLKKYRDAFKLSMPETARVNRGDFEIDPEEDLQSQVKQVVTLLLFKQFDLDISPQVEEE
jgi:hypothetical protein